MTSTINSVRVKNSNIDTIVIVKKLYDLKKELEDSYSGSLRSNKYEQTREFNIALYHTIYRANHNLALKSLQPEEMIDLEKNLQSLQKRFKELKLEA